MTTHQRTLQTELDILVFLTTRPGPATTADVSDAFNISLYKARYHLRQLVLAGVVQELSHGRGSATYWQCCCHN
ncbi:FaeA/PapI family transcriptional regulator [Aeromonas veronii]|uniref:FaeA/PapI family transcriptional regulator n=1 Tax=Aeromonas TaxID=642 RepID=UPI0009B731E4|nr:FaeA/PapI family transcriptional regulator [Aeromonas jandaei]QMS74915.1 pilus assembly protein [Aeromonas veronii Hm21]TNI04744.1 pilus assembly protein [Aeromonas veronii]TNH96985.1 pilus assembly protein [Aeromonas jandaei]HDO1313691.1 pilus assembly protein [Aeromonas veronii]HDO1318400.1 pilus assembly protein [Aeromonas veronii]